MRAKQPPTDTFTLVEFCKRYTVNRYKAQREIADFLETGIITEVGSFGSAGAKYYRFIKPVRAVKTGKTKKANRQK